MANSSAGKIIGIILGVIVVLGVGAFAARSYLPASVQKYIPEISTSAGDAQTELNAALANSFNVESANFKAKMEISADDIDGSGGTMTFDIDGAVADVYSAIPKIDYSIGISVDGTFEGETVQASAKADLRMIDDKVFVRLAEINFPETTSADPDMAMAEMMVSAFVGKWYAMPIPTEQIEAQTEMQQKLIALLKDTFQNQEFLLIVNDLGDGKMEVEPNFDVILSAEFLNTFLGGIQTAMLSDPSMTEEMKAALQSEDMQFSDAELAETRNAVEYFWNTVDPKIIVTIEDGYVVGYDISASVDLSKFDPEMTGKIDFTMQTENSDINKNIAIEQPADYEEIDPSMFGMPGLEMDDGMMMIDDDFGGEDLDMLMLEEAPRTRPAGE